MTNPMSISASQARTSLGNIARSRAILERIVEAGSFHMILGCVAVGME